MIQGWRCDADDTEALAKGKGAPHFCGKLWDNCGTQNRAVFWPFGKRVTELLILDKKERVAESQ